MRGRKPIPNELKELHGNRGHRPIPKTVTAGYDLNAPPEWLTVQQKMAWDYAITYAPAGLLKMIDRSTLATWVIAEDLHKQAAQKIEQFGMLTKSPVKGEPMQSPYLPILNKQAQIMMKAAAELGFTPSSRSRIKTEDGYDGSSDSLQEFMSH